MTIGSFILLLIAGWLLLASATLWAMLRLARAHARRRPRAVARQRQSVRRHATA